MTIVKGSLLSKDSVIPTEPVTHVDMIVGGVRSGRQSYNHIFVKSNQRS